MKRFSLTKGIILFSLLLFPVLLFLLFSAGNLNRTYRPFYGPKETKVTVVNGEERIDTIYHTIPPFSFTNQYGETVTEKDIEGKIVIVDFFFTRCQTICPRMTAQLNEVQSRLKGYKNVLLLSHTVDPKNDSVEVLREYAEKWEAEKGRWHFLTGEKENLYSLARHGYLITAMDGDDGPDAFIHSEKIVLIDEGGRIRGFYDGTSYGEVKDLIEDARDLIIQGFTKKKDDD